jgi:hypothetical protein
MPKTIQATFGAALGAAAFGFFLYVPAVFAFDSLGLLGAGAWLGLCTLLIPLGVLVAAPSSFEPVSRRRGPDVLTRRSSAPRSPVALGSASLESSWPPRASGSSAPAWSRPPSRISELSAPVPGSRPVQVCCFCSAP